MENPKEMGAAEPSLVEQLGIHVLNLLQDVKGHFIAKHILVLHMKKSRLNFTAEDKGSWENGGI